MNAKIIIYLITILASTFTVSGLNINNLFKRDHIWEARSFVVILIISMSYILTNFLYDLVTITSGNI